MSHKPVREIPHPSGRGAMVQVTGSFPAEASTTWILRNVGSERNYPRIRLGYGNSYPTAPHLSATNFSVAAGTAVNRVAGSWSIGSGTGAPTWSWSGEIPPGLDLNTATGRITGTPTVAGVYVPTITVTLPSGQQPLPQAIRITVS